MRTIILLISFSFFGHALMAQNVGVGTTTPSEKLDVNGNINLNGQLKVNTDSGKANQVLMKNSSNSLIWGDLSQFKDQVVFDCGNFAAAAGTGNCSQGWTVPTGVTRILVECWGGGGGGCSLSGGGGGGYISTLLTVTPGNLITFTIGAGGVYGTNNTNGIVGGTTSFSYSGFAYNAGGGAGGSYGDPFTFSVSQVSVPPGGNFSSTAPVGSYMGFQGQPGGYSKLKFTQTGASEFAHVVEYGDGGDAAMMPNSGGKGGYRIISATYNYTAYAVQLAPYPGGGGSADYGAGWTGKGGRVIVHY